VHSIAQETAAKKPEDFIPRFFGAVERCERADIDWWTDDRTFTMSWTERDGPPVWTPQQRRFGGVVMQEMPSAAWTVRSTLNTRPSGLALGLPGGECA
jgi:hypothetical protein